MKAYMLNELLLCLKPLFPMSKELLRQTKTKKYFLYKGWLAIAKLKPLLLFISLFLMLKKAFENVKIEK